MSSDSSRSPSPAGERRPAGSPGCHAGGPNKSGQQATSNPFSIDYILSSAAAVKALAQQHHQDNQGALLIQQHLSLVGPSRAHQLSPTPPPPAAAGDQFGPFPVHQTPASGANAHHRLDDKLHQPHLHQQQQQPQPQPQPQPAHPNFFYLMACMLLHHQQQQQQQLQHQQHQQQHQQQQQQQQRPAQQPLRPDRQKLTAIRQPTDLVRSPMENLAFLAQFNGLAQQPELPAGAKLNQRLLAGHQQSLRHQPYPILPHRSGSASVAGRAPAISYSAPISMLHLQPSDAAQTPLGSLRAPAAMDSPLELLAGQQQRSRASGQHFQQILAANKCAQQLRPLQQHQHQQHQHQQHQLQHQPSGNKFAPGANQPQPHGGSSSGQLQLGLAGDRCQMELSASSNQDKLSSGQLDNLKPAHSYIGLIGMCILSSPEKRMVLNDIYQFILDNYPYYRNRGSGWRNSVRHNLSLNECFQKAGRAANGKGHYWTIHPANMEDFMLGDFRRRRAQRKVRRWNNMDVLTDESEDESVEEASKPALPEHFKRSLEMHRQLQLSYHHKSLELNGGPATPGAHHQASLVVGLVSPTGNPALAQAASSQLFGKQQEI